MKIGILTASRTDNNGTDLQALAMLNMFRRLGVTNIEIIDYVCEKIDTKKTIKINAHNLFNLPVILYNKYSHRIFRNKYFCKSTYTYDKSNIHTVPYDTIVVGSDQIWNLDITGGDVSFYLPFTKKGIQKFSYAASLGIALIEKWDKIYEIKKLLNDFDGISVRETTSVAALESIGVKCHNDLDPILMGKKEDWLRFITPAKRKNYILLYLVSYNPMAIEYAQIVAKQREAKIIMLNPGIKRWKGVERHYFVSVENWLNLMANADVIVTNSYHGLSFAILFQREFRLCLLPTSSLNNSRMLDLVENLRLNNYIIRDKNDTFEPINWARTNNHLKKMIERSEQYIKSIIKDS